MVVFSSDQFRFTLPVWHRFPLEKYERLRQRVVREGIVRPDEVVTPQAATDEQLSFAHEISYLRAVQEGTLSEAEVREIGFPWSVELVERSRRSCGGTIEACRVAVERGIAVNLAGGTHHARSSKGAGYCIFNDAVVAARTMQRQGLVGRVLVVDCDVHQGDGTASICEGDDSIYTYSIHAARNYPLRKVSGDLDVALEDGTGDAAYLAALTESLDRAIREARADLVVYLAGADPFEHDRLGRLKLTKSGLIERDRLVFERCRSLGMPIAVAMAGGYAQDIEDTIEIQANTVRLASLFARS